LVTSNRIGIRLFVERMKDALDCASFVACICDLQGLGYNRAEVDGPLMNAKAHETAGTYPLCGLDCYPLERVPVNREYLAGVAAS